MKIWKHNDDVKFNAPEYVGNMYFAIIYKALRDVFPFTKHIVNCAKVGMYINTKYI